MQSIYLNFVVWVTASLFFTAAKPLTLSHPKHLTARIPVHQPQDIDVQIGGAPAYTLPQKNTILFFHIIQLEIYRDTLTRGGDAVLTESVWKRKWGGLTLRVQPALPSTTTWADVLFGLQKILQHMIDPDEPEGFRESNWRVGRREPGAPYESMVTVAMVDLYRDLPESSLQTPAPLTNTSFNNSGPLSAPFVVPTTKLTLLIGPHGADLKRSPVVQSLDGLISDAWRRVAINGRAAKLVSITFGSRHPDEMFWGIIRPRRNEAGSLFTESDLVETTVGIVYYMVQHGFYATKVTVARSDERGRRTVIGEVEITAGQMPRTEPMDSMNASLMKIS
ncbi:hypothetical protein G7Y79_00018g045990 [Physcia stellaris]|nr:hypothetical protein G7Y79_00018g045990 [Physcia stellaris]